MRRLLMLGASVSVLTILVTVVSADQWVRGKVTAVGPDTVTVTFKGKEMKFNVAADVEVIGRGLGTVQRRTGGLKLAEAIKVGDGVEVHYTETGGTMRASEIRTGLAGTEASSEDAGDSTSGRVTALTTSSMTIKSSGGESVFSIDRDTRVLFRGAGQATAEARKAGGGPTIVDLVKVGEDVVVSYRTTGSTRVAREVRVRGAQR